MTFEGRDIDTFADSGSMTDDFDYARGKGKKRRKKRKAKRKAKKSKHKAKRKSKRAKRKAKRKAKHNKGDGDDSADEQTPATDTPTETPATDTPATPDMPTETPATDDNSSPADDEAPADETADDNTSDADEGGDGDSDEENAEGSEKPATAQGTGGSSFASTAMKYKKPVVNFVLPAIGFAAGATIGHKMGSKDGKTSYKHIIVGGLIGAAVFSIPAVYEASTKKDGTK